VFYDKNYGNHGRGVFTSRGKYMCRGAEIVNRIHDYIKFSADRACLGYPQGVRAKVIIRRNAVCYDGSCYRTWTDVTRLSPFVHRG
jgi:hypothetical protein